MTCSRQFEMGLKVRTETGPGRYNLRNRSQMDAASQATYFLDQLLGGRVHLGTRTFPPPPSLFVTARRWHPGYSTACQTGQLLFDSPDIIFNVYSHRDQNHTEDWYTAFSGQQFAKMTKMTNLDSSHITQNLEYIKSTYLAKISINL